jgi:hypothetical protein
MSLLADSGPLLCCPKEGLKLARSAGASAAAVHGERLVDRRNLVTCRQCHKLTAITGEERSGADDERAGPAIDKCREGRFEIVVAARIQDNDLPPECVPRRDDVARPFLGRRTFWIRKKSPPSPHGEPDHAGGRALVIFITSSTFVTCCTGRSAGLPPARIDPISNTASGAHEAARHDEFAKLVNRGHSVPTQPVRIVVGYGAGGVSDLIAPDRAKRLGQPFIVENPSGGGTNIATEAIVRAPADGYSLLLVAPPSAINATLYESSISLSSATSRRSQALTAPGA